MKFEVSIKEVHDVTVVVDTDSVGLSESPSREELASAAEQIYQENEDPETAYSHTLEYDAWTIRSVETGNYLP